MEIESRVFIVEDDHQYGLVSTLFKLHIVKVYIDARMSYRRFMGDIGHG